MKKTNTGFEAYYYDSSTGKELANEIMYDWEELYGSSEEEIYVGFAAARNMTIKVDEIDRLFQIQQPILQQKNDQTKSSSQSIVSRQATIQEMRTTCYPLKRMRTDS